MWKGVISKDVLDKKAKRWANMKAEDAEKEFFWWLAGATFLQLGTWSAGYSYKEVVWMETEASKLECRGDTILQVVLIPVEGLLWSMASLSCRRLSRSIHSSQEIPGNSFVSKVRRRKY